MTGGPQMNGVLHGAAAPSPLRIPLACAWLLMLVTFSVPGRDASTGGGGFDVIGLAKLGVRGLVMLLLAREMARSWASPRRPAVVWCLTPFAAYLGWALVTIAWSPMKTMSLGQWGSLTAQVLLTVVVALRWQTPRDTSDLIRHLCLALVGISGLVLAVDVVNHDLSGLNRDDFDWPGSNGLFHPTSLGAIGSLGVVMLVAARVLWGWRWTRTLLYPGLGLTGTLLLLAHSRMAAVMAAVVLGLTLIRYTGMRALAGAAVAASLLGAAYLALDPGLTAVSDVRRDLTEYFRRGETDEQMSSFNGRGELWDVVWDEFTRSPLVGHGYFMTSRTGIIDVWSGPAPRTAHNLELQVLVSTGILGGLLFLWALVRPIRAAVGGLGGAGEVARLRAFLLLVGIWYLGWGQLCESFMGPVQPESVVFYSLLGLMLAQVRYTPVSPAPAEDRP